MKANFSRKIFLVANSIFCILVALICVLPVLHVLAVSFSAKLPVEAGRVAFWPKDFTMSNYNIVMRDAQFFTSYRVSLVRTAMGLAFELLVTVLCAYPLSMSKRDFPERKYYVWFFMVTMLFNGGMIPTYLVVNSVGLINTIWALIIPCCVNTYYIILIMNFMKGLPDAVREAAFIDGAGHITTLFKIILPMCLPSLATVSLFIILQHWNAWFDGMLYIRISELKPLQTYLRSITIVNDSLNTILEENESLFSTEGANGAKIFLTLIPIFCLYPFVQRFFITGIVQGSTKE